MPFEPLLSHHLETADFTVESEFAYRLCYQCHSRNSILSDESFPLHRLHLDERIPCSACHDPHGISSAQGNAMNHSNLINFDISIVAPDTNGILEFSDKGVFRGECTLSCHGSNHSSRAY